MMMKVAGIAEDSIVDGSGLRLTVFVQGCSHHCPGCHNPETHDPDGGKLMDIAEIVAKFDANPLLDGITLSGGEPFDQPAPCLELLSKVYHKCGSIWCYTGYTIEELMERQESAIRCMLEHIDVLVDGRFIQHARTLEMPWRGSKNQRLIDVKETIRTGKVVEYIVSAETADETWNRRA